MQIIQLLPTIQFGDAVSNDARAIDAIIREQGYSTAIYAENIDAHLPKGTAQLASNMPRLRDDDILIYHASTGTRLNYELPNFGGRQVMFYHNITPPQYFHGYNESAENLTKSGYEGMRFLSDKVNYCIADSDYNRQDLRRMGFKCPIDVCPIIIPFEDYDQEPNARLLNQYRGKKWTNLLFVGRIAANKKQQDVIRAFYCYQKRYNPKSRLFLVGNIQGMERYAIQLQRYTQLLGIEDKVVFTGHVKFDEILAYYRMADIFVCMSEHEGFCVPLVEAMYFGIPIVARRTSAISGTLGKGGLLLNDNSPEMAAAAIDRVLKDEALRDFLAEQQEKRLDELKYESVKQQVLACIDKMTRL